MCLWGGHWLSPLFWSKLCTQLSNFYILSSEKVHRKASSYRWQPWITKEHIYCTLSNGLQQKSKYKGEGFFWWLLEKCLVGKVDCISVKSWWLKMIWFTFHIHMTGFRWGLKERILMGDFSLRWTQVVRNAGLKANDLVSWARSYFPCDWWLHYIGAVVNFKCILEPKVSAKINLKCADFSTHCVVSSGQTVLTSLIS